MSWIAAATVGGALISSNASSRANKGQQQAAAEATGVQQREAARVRADQTPYREAGYGALQQINALLGITPVASGGGQQSTYDQIRERLLPNYVGNYGGNGINDAALDAAAQAEYARVMQQQQRVPSPTQTGAQQPAANPLQALQQMPGYQFGMQQGQQALERSAAARGGLYSGNALKATTRFGQDYAGTKFGEHYNRLASVAGLGQTSLGTTANTGMAFGNQAGYNAIGAGNAGAANALNQGNIMGNAVNQIGAYANRQWGNQVRSPSQGFQNADWWQGGDGWEGE
jgi:hypothetical protein